MDLRRPDRKQEALAKALGSLPDVTPVAAHSGQVLLYPHHVPNGLYLVLQGVVRKDSNRLMDASRGPFLIQGQYLRSRIDRNRLGNLAFGAWYAQASFVVTGENYDYGRSTGTVAGVDVRRKGNAVELAARISGIDLQDDNLRAGRGRTYTVGANYYLNRNVRFMVNYARSRAHDVGPLNEDRRTSLVAGRFQVAF